MKNIYLHIGAPKTGTTAIQEVLYALERHKILEKYDFSLLSNASNIASYIRYAQHPMLDKEYFSAMLSEKIKQGLQNIFTRNIALSYEDLSNTKILENIEIITILAKLFSSYNLLSTCYCKDFRCVLTQ